MKINDKEFIENLHSVLDEAIKDWRHNRRSEVYVVKDILRPLSIRELCAISVFITQLEEYKKLDPKVRQKVTSRCHKLCHVINY